MAFPAYTPIFYMATVHVYFINQVLGGVKAVRITDAL